MRSKPAPRRRAPLRRAGVAATVLLGLAFAGCGRAEPGVVAYVGDSEISQMQVDDAVRGLSASLEEGQAVSAEAVVSAMIQGELAEQIAADKKIAITDADRGAVLRGSNLEALADQPESRPVVQDVADQAIVSQKLGAEAFLAEIKQRDVVLNPRYGVLDPETQTVASGQSGSLSQPAPEAAPTP